MKRQQIDLPSEKENLRINGGGFSCPLNDNNIE